MEKIREITLSKKNKFESIVLPALGVVLMFAVLSIKWNDFIFGSKSWLLFASVPIMVILHEGLHGLLFWIWGGKVKFGYITSVIGPSFYATSLGRRFPRNKFIVICLLPQVVTLVTIPLSMFYSGWLGFLILSVGALNFGGAVADFYIVYRLLRTKGNIEVEDKVTGVAIYE